MIEARGKNRRQDKRQAVRVRNPFMILFFLVIPVAEIAIFIMVGERIGVLPTLGLVFLSAIVGSVLLRIQGFGLLRRMSLELDAGRVPARELVHGALILFAGLLLLLPGFLTDVFGLLLFIPAVRDLVWKLVGSRFVTRVDVTSASGRYPRTDGQRTIDLDPKDYGRGDDDDGFPGPGPDGTKR